MHATEKQVAMAAQAYLDTDIRLTEAVATGTPLSACTAESVQALKTLCAVMLDQGVINSFETIVEAYPDPNLRRLVQVTVEGIVGKFTLFISPRDGEVSVL